MTRTLRSSSNPIVLALAGIAISVVSVWLCSDLRDAETPEYLGHSLFHWIRGAESPQPAEQRTAVAVLSVILGSMHSGPGPMSCAFPSLTVRSPQRRLNFSRAHVRAHLPQIILSLQLAATASDPGTREAALQGLSTACWWQGPEEMRLVIPTLINGCRDEDSKVRMAAHGYLIQTLQHSNVDYKTLPVSALLPIMSAALARDDLVDGAMYVLGKMGTLAGEEFLPLLINIQSNRSGALSFRADWAIMRIDGFK